jgi:hypothetical protein
MEWYSASRLDKQIEMPLASLKVSGHSQTHSFRHEPSYALPSEGCPI